VATINSGNSTTLYSTTQTTTSVNTPPSLPQPQVNETNFTTLYSNPSAAGQGGGTSGNLLVTGNLRVLGTSDLEGAVTISNSYILPTSDGTNNQVITTDGNGNLTFQDVDAIDNIPDGTAVGQVLYWNGSDWIAATTLPFDATANRLRLVNNISGVSSSAIELLKQYTTTLADGSNVGQLYGFTNGGTIVAPTNPIYTHQITSEYDTGGNPIYRVRVDPVGNFGPSSTTAYNQLRLDNDSLNINGNQVIVNANLTGTPTEDGIFKVERGTSTDATLTWSEANDRWEFTNDLFVANDYKQNGQNITINADNTAADSYLYLKGTSVAIKYNNTTDFIEMPRTAINNILLNTNTISTSTGPLILDSASTAVNVDNDLYIGGIAEVGGEYFKINSDNTNADTFLYMKGMGQHLRWDVTDQLFVFNKSLFVNGDIIADDVLATNGTNIYFNNDDGLPQDCFLGVKRGVDPDVNIKWDNTAARWQFTNDGTTYYNMAVNIDDLADVVITPPIASGQFLVQDGTNWINSNIVTATAAADRPRFQYNDSTAGVSSSMFIRKNYGATSFTTGDGTSIGIQLVSNSQNAQQIATIGASYDATAPVIFLATNANANTTGPFIVAADFSSAAANLAGSALTLSSENTGAGTDSYIYANRGSSGADAYLQWNEADDIWTFSNSLYANGAIIAGGDLATNGNNIVFNNDDGAAADCFLQVKRGASPDVNIKWNNTAARWQTTTDGTNYLNIPNQNLDTDSNVTFASVTVDGGHTVIDTTTTTTTSTTQTAITATSNTTTRSSKFQIQVTDNVTGNIHVLEALIFFQGTTAYLTTYAEMYNSTSLATFAADVDSGNTRLLATPASANNTTFKVTRISVAL